MNKPNVKKRMAVLAAVILVTVSSFSAGASEMTDSSESLDSAGADETNIGYAADSQDSDDSSAEDVSFADGAEETEDAADETEDNSDETGETESAASQTTGINLGDYTDKLEEIQQEQERIEQELAQAEEKLLDEEETLALYKDEIQNINEKISVMNSYMTSLELEISTQKLKAGQLREELDEGVEKYKLRLRALYIAGETSYADVVLSAGDFYDILMRSELVRRISEYDAEYLNKLVEDKAEYEEKLAELEEKQAVYDEQAELLQAEKERLEELYNSSEEAKRLIEEEKESLELEQSDFEDELGSYSEILGDILKGTYSSSADETQRLQTELAAMSALSELKSQISERVKNGEEISETECRYNFAWPVPSSYYVTSGVGERWGSYHKGLDISGNSGASICASEAGTVIRVNNSCTHNYGKTSSCGCGGGYGNFVIIDHGNGFITLYGHLTQALVEVGDTVTQGQQIGLMGSTGYSTGAHLHFELRYEGYITDPTQFLSY